jgi:MoaA/NifB/PqqE/SkfB family radical SAM enzyme
MKKIVFLLYRSYAVTVRRFLLVSDLLSKRGIKPVFFDLSGKLDSEIQEQINLLKLNLNVEYFSLRDFSPESNENLIIDDNKVIEKPNMVELNQKVVTRLEDIVNKAGNTFNSFFNYKIDQEKNSFLQIFHQSQNALELIKPDIVVFDLETDLLIRAFLLAAKLKDVRIVAMQHAEGYAEQYRKFPLFADYYFAYSYYNLNKLLSMGVSIDQIALTGVPETDYLYKLLTTHKKDAKIKKIILALKPSRHSEFIELNKKMIEMAKDVFRSEKNWEIYVKQHPIDLSYEVKTDYTPLLNDINNFHYIQGEQNIADYFAITDITICAFTSSIVESVMLGSYPVVLNEDSNIGWPAWYNYNVFTKIDFSEYEKTLVDIKNNPDKYVNDKNSVDDFIKNFRFKLDDKNTMRVVDFFESLLNGIKLTETVDIIMPTYQPNPFYLKRAIQSIIDQSYENWELFLVQDGNDVDIQSLMVELNDPRIHYLEIPHKGKPAALNYALSKSCSKYIAYLDDDDIWYPIHLHEIMYYMKATGAKFVHTNCDEVFVEATEKDSFKEVSRQSLNKGAMTDKTMWYISHINTIHERELLKQTGLYNESLMFFIDWDMFLRLAQVTEPYHVNVLTCEHYMYLDKENVSNTISSIHKSKPELASNRLNEMLKKSFELITPKDFSEIARDWQDKMFMLEYFKSELVGAKNRISELENKLSEIKSKENMNVDQNKSELKLSESVLSPKPLGIICVNPFYEFEIDVTGNVVVCCTGWLKHSLGNMKNQTIGEVWNSQVARYIRRKMYKAEWEDICNPNCPKIVNYKKYKTVIKYEDLNKIQNLTPKHIEEIAAGKDYLESTPTVFKLSDSKVCNLKCKMCSVVNSESYADDKEMIERRTIDLEKYLDKAKVILMSGNGDPFARKDTRELMINYKNGKSDLRFSLVTNGLLLPRYWDKIKHQKFDAINVSLDSVTKEVYEKIRIGGKYEDIMKSINLIEENKEKFKHVVLSMVVMRSNYKEIPAFIDFAEGRGFIPLFSRLQGMVDDENIFEMNDRAALEELRLIINSEIKKKRTVNVNWQDIIEFAD